MSSGFVRLDRKFFDHHLWKEERSYSPAEAWLDLIASARFEVEPEKIMIRMNIINIERGELRASLRYLSNRWNWSTGKVTRFLQLLENETMIERKTKHGETVVTVLNYSKFNPLQNDERNSNETPIETPTEQERNTNETAAKQTKESKEGKEPKELKKKGSVSKSDFDLSFVPTIYKPLIEEFIRYRKQDLKKPFKTSNAVKIFFENLRKESNNNISKAKDLVDYAKGREWMTVFPIPKKQKAQEKFRNESIPEYDNKL